MCKFCPDNRFLITGDIKGQLVLWDILSGNVSKETSTKNSGLITKHSGLITTACFIDQLLCTCSLDQTVLLWDLENLTVLVSLPHSAGISSVGCFKSESAGILRLVSGCVNGVITVWEVTSDKETVGLSVHHMAEYSACNKLHKIGCNDHLVVVCAESSSEVFDTLTLRQGYGQTILKHIERNGLDSYVPVGDSFQAMQECGTGHLDECQKELDACLLEYLYDPSIPEQSSITEIETDAPLSSDQRSKKFPIVKFQTSKSIHSCAFPVNDTTQEILFTGENNILGVWCLVTGSMLFQKPLPDQIQSIHVIFEPATVHLSIHKLFCICGNKLLELKLSGMLELQALAEYAQSQKTSSHSVFTWGSHPRLPALQRALTRIGTHLSESERQRLFVLQQIPCSKDNSQDFKRKCTNHGANSQTFLLTLIARTEEQVGQFGNRLLHNMEAHHVSFDQMCTSIVKTPAPYAKVLQVLALHPADKAMYHCAKSGTSFQGPLQHHQIHHITGKVNMCGGDPSLGMFEIANHAPFFYHHSVERSRPEEPRDGVTLEFNILAKELMSKTRPTVKPPSLLKIPRESPNRPHRTIS